MSRPRFLRWLIVCITLLLLPVLALPASASTATPATFCGQVQLPVALQPGQPASYQVVGWLCSRPPLRGRTIQVLVAGATYSHLYWDFPVRPERYSYVRALTDAGYATLTIDRIGIGVSSHPAPEQIDVEANAFVLHQVVQALRLGQVIDLFPKIILVGHSLGSSIALTEASRYHDVDGVIVSGFTHTITPAFLNAGQVLYPANQDGRFNGLNLPDGYLTTLPGTRGLVFYSGPNAEADVIVQDEATKETVTQAELYGLAGVILNGDLSRAIQVPVLSVVGQQDLFFCSDAACSNAQAETTFYGPQAQLELQVLPGFGHDLNLHLNAPTWFALARDWSDRHFGPR